MADRTSSFTFHDAVHHKKNLHQCTVPIHTEAVQSRGQFGVFHLLVRWCLTALSAKTGYMVPESEIYCVGLGDKTNTQLNNETRH